MRDLLPANRPALVLAPMQDVTDLPFMRVLARRGAPDWFVTEYFRVHPDSRLDKYIVRSIQENETGKPIFAQMIGRDIPNLIRTTQELAELNIAGIDLNLGCPAPIVCRKDAGGGLLRNPENVDRLIGELRAAIPGRFTVKTRVGYETPDEFEGLLEIFRRHAIDCLSIHGRTVKERYQTPVHPDCIRAAVATMPCPVIANGNVVDVPTGLAYLQQTNAAGLMIGRGAIRNPWIFSQLIAAFEKRDSIAPTRRDLLDYIFDLYDEMARETLKFDPMSHVQRMKRPLVYISHGLDADFEHRIRRAKTPDEFHAICRDHLDNDQRLPVQPPSTSKLYCGFEDLVRA
ncbi:tRNA-dihydrouridine synthase family protein [Luteolibacter pohnpeiensis]|uniref:tRNA-dihydrouridine synthase n=1 Tax=Luteolibacter pohnpeiensis TaxID=454153 RepID=A0A934S322_9BACT|nr:tRNA-dihydrouridine synthase family protein [Luteolibacter pohnpeiensis]MBK1882250.1 tRNA-dihydrouridine synthase family protein [Luteolibacter pohnpeiensis]